MSIIIHGMDMPKNEELWIRVQPDGNIVSQTGYVIEDAFAKQLSPNGRLIDADALTDNCMKEDGFLAEMLFRKVSNAPTILDSDNNVPCKEEVKK